MRHQLARGALLCTLTLATACGSEPTNVTPTEVQFSAQQSAAAAAARASEGHRQYGAPVRIGGGRARAYVLVAPGSAKIPLEVGVALDERALNGLGSEMQMLSLPLPPLSPEPYQFVLFDWNPMGHEPTGIYTFPHFDFHFYTVPEADVNAILATDPGFAEKANNLPTGGYVPPFYTVLAPPGSPPASVAVPMMGVHWVDVRSPELQGAFGNPAGYQDFTTTFIHGSWDGRLTFFEPMITLAYLRSLPDVTVPIPRPALYPEPGWYPDAYSIVYDAGAREYRVALTGLGWRD